MPIQIMSKGRLRQSLYLYDGKREIDIWELRFIKNHTQMLILNTPKKGFHYHFWHDDLGRVVGHIKNERNFELINKLLNRSLFNGDCIKKGGGSIIFETTGKISREGALKILKEVEKLCGLEKWE